MLPDDEQQPEGDEEEEELPVTPPAPKITADQITLDGEPEGEKPEGEEEKPDPLASLSISDLLNHPQLGREIQSWADSSGNARLQAERAQVRQELETEYEYNQLEAEFANMSREDWQEAVSEDPNTVERFARFKALRSMREGNKNNAEIADKAELLALTSQISTYTELLKANGLDADPALNPANFTKKPDGSPAGRQGIVAWGTAISQALVAKALAEKWETYKQDELAKLDGKSKRKAPELTNGQPRGAVRLTREVLNKMSPEEVAKLYETPEGTQAVERILSAKA